MSEILSSLSTGFVHARFADARGGLAAVPRSLAALEAIGAGAAELFVIDQLLRARAVVLPLKDTAAFAKCRPYWGRLQLHPGRRQLRYGKFAVRVVTSQQRLFSLCPPRLTTN